MAPGSRFAHPRGGQRSRRRAARRGKPWGIGQSDNVASRAPGLPPRRVALFWRARDDPRARPRRRGTPHHASPIHGCKTPTGAGSSRRPYPSTVSPAGHRVWLGDLGESFSRSPAGLIASPRSREPVCWVAFCFRWADPVGARSTIRLLTVPASPRAPVGVAAPASASLAAVSSGGAGVPGLAREGACAESVARPHPAERSAPRGDAPLPRPRHQSTEYRARTDRALSERARRSWHDLGRRPSATAARRRGRSWAARQTTLRAAWPTSTSASDVSPAMVETCVVRGSRNVRFEVGDVRDLSRFAARRVRRRPLQLQRDRLPSGATPPASVPSPSCAACARAAAGCSSRARTSTSFRRRGACRCRLRRALAAYDAAAVPSVRLARGAGRFARARALNPSARSARRGAAAWSPTTATD